MKNRLKKGICLSVENKSPTRFNIKASISKWGRVLSGHNYAIPNTNSLRNHVKIFSAKTFNKHISN